MLQPTNKYMQTDAKKLQIVADSSQMAADSYITSRNKWESIDTQVGEGEGEGEGDIDVITSTCNKQVYLLYIAY